MPRFSLGRLSLLAVVSVGLSSLAYFQLAARGQGQIIVPNSGNMAGKPPITAKAPEQQVLPASNSANPTKSMSPPSGGMGMPPGPRMMNTIAGIDPQQAERSVARLSQQLSLSAEQKQQIEALLNEQLPQLTQAQQQWQQSQHALNSLAVDSQDYETQLQAVVQQTSALYQQQLERSALLRQEIYRVLSKEQQTQLSQQEQKMQQAGPRPDMPRPAERPFTNSQREPS